MSSDTLTRELRQRKRLRLQILVDAVQNFVQVAAFGLEPRFGGGFFHLHEEHAGVGGSGGLAEGVKPILLRACGADRRRSPGSRARAPCILAFTALMAKVECWVSSLPWNTLFSSFSCGSWRTMQDDLVLYVDARVVVVVIFVGGDSVARRTPPAPETVPEEEKLNGMNPSRSAQRGWYSLRNGYSAPRWAPTVVVNACW